MAFSTESLTRKSTKLTVINTFHFSFLTFANRATTDRRVYHLLQKKMHLWPTMRLRESFKESYLRKLEWNYHRMDIEKRQQQQRNQSDSTQQKLLETGKSDSEDSGCGGIEVMVREILMLLSCCYCCFCCGGNPIFTRAILIILFSGVYCSCGIDLVERIAENGNRIRVGFIVGSDLMIDEAFGSMVGFDPNRFIEFSV